MVEGGKSTEPVILEVSSDQVEPELSLISFTDEQWHWISENKPTVIKIVDDSYIYYWTVLAIYFNWSGQTAIQIFYHDGKDVRSTKNDNAPK